MGLRLSKDSNNNRLPERCLAYFFEKKEKAKRLYSKPLEYTEGIVILIGTGSFGKRFAYFLDKDEFDNFNTDFDKYDWYLMDIEKYKNLLNINMQGLFTL